MAHRTITSDADLELYRQETDGKIIYQRLGAVVGDVRIDRDGNLYVTGACTVEDGQLADARKVAEAADLKTTITDWEAQKLEPVGEPS